MTQESEAIVGMSEAASGLCFVLKVQSLPAAAVCLISLNLLTSPHRVLLAKMEKLELREPPALL